MCVCIFLWFLSSFLPRHTLYVILPWYPWFFFKFHKKYLIYGFQVRRLHFVKKQTLLHFSSSCIIFGYHLYDRSKVWSFQQTFICHYYFHVFDLLQCTLAQLLTPCHYGSLKIGSQCMGSVSILKTCQCYIKISSCIIFSIICMIGVCKVTSFQRASDFTIIFMYLIYYIVHWTTTVNTLSLWVSKKMGSQCMHSVSISRNMSMLYYDF